MWNRVGSRLTWEAMRWEIIISSTFCYYWTFKLYSNLSDGGVAMKTYYFKRLQNPSKLQEKQTKQKMKKKAKLNDKWEIRIACLKCGRDHKLRRVIEIHISSSIYLQESSGKVYSYWAAAVLAQHFRTRNHQVRKVCLRSFCFNSIVE